MIVQCPSCRERISSRHETCPHCGYNSAAGEEAARAESHYRRRLSARIQAQLYLAMLLTVIGVLGFFTAEAEAWRRASVYALAGGIVWYLALRAFMIYQQVRRSDN